MQRNLKYSGSKEKGDRLLYITAVFSPDGKLDQGVANTLLEQFKTSFSQRDSMKEPFSSNVYRSYNTYYESSKVVLQIKYELGNSAEPFYSGAYNLAKRDGENLVDQMDCLLSPFDE